MKNETNIRSRYTKNVVIETEPGRPMHNNYQVRINENGHKEIYKIGEHNLQAEIEAQAEENEIGNILKRYEGGDVQALNKAKAGYVDMTQMPKDLREAQDTVLRLKNEFMTLPIDVRRKFDHSPEKYIAEYGNKYWLEAIQPTTNYKEVETKEDTPVTEKEKGVEKNE